MDNNVPADPFAILLRPSLSQAISKPNASEQQAISNHSASGTQATRKLTDSKTQAKRKRNASSSLFVRLEEDLFDRLRAHADAKRLTVAAFVRQWIVGLPERPVGK